MGGGSQLMSVVQTRLSSRDLLAAESGVDRIAGRWSLARVIEAGIGKLDADTLKPEPVRPLLEEWLPIVRAEVGDRWYSQLRGRCGAVLDALGEPTTAAFTRENFRAYLDGLKCEPQTKAILRNCVHRFGGWLIERGKLARDANPGAGIRISRKRAAGGQAKMPAVFLAAQAEAFLRACETAECRRLKGWAVLCLLCGLRPDSEAPRLAWAEIKLELGELTVMGRKRGAKPRIVKLQPAAGAWLRAVKRDGEEFPGRYWRHLRDRAVDLANEWLAAHHPGAPAIEWSTDVQRHTYVSMRAGQGAVMHAVAEECGTSVTVIYGHYRNPRPAAEVKAFWALRPADSKKSLGR